MNEAILAVAGAGKTHDICKEASGIYTSKKILITTFTNNGVNSIVDEYKRHNSGIMSENVVIKTWFGFMLYDLIKPYQRSLTNKEYAVKGYNFLEHLPNYIYKLKRNNPNYYLDGNGNAYYQNASELALKCNEISKGAVIKRLEEIYSHIFIDEIQDVAGYDFSWVQMFCGSKIKIVMVGDYKQTIFSTNNKNINKHKTGVNLITGFTELEKSGVLKIKRNNKTRRFNNDIAVFANRLFEQREYDIESDILPKANDGVFILTDADYQDYVNAMGHTVFLRYDKKDSRLNSLSPLESYNFGDCKGMTFERVAISTTTKTLKDYILQNKKLADKTKAKYYIALTRARKSVTIIMDKLPSMVDFIQVEMNCNGKMIRLLKFNPCTDIKSHE